MVTRRGNHLDAVMKPCHRLGMTDIISRADALELSRIFLNFAVRAFGSENACELGGKLLRYRG